MADPAQQARIQNAKEQLKAAYSYAVSAKESAESDFKQAQDAGIADGQDFKNWAVQNAPAYLVALQQYQAAKAGYDAALQNGDNEAFIAWDKKYKEAFLANPAKPDYDALVEP
ncbi:hypothetical protein IWW34DRAFT_829359 [Fusarium oxysporum f. sp. albedinis]|uniref:Uncharacterized protein n=1 Tax=Fusarium oxysporum TaxID=5507 RepID=A0A420S0U1_FUSOX|nr:hypothetical protein FOCG_03644 [Fusarium oxysporum f. sp. radicis-lycopersici 26381]KAF5260541.1 hypothetical protein FOXYS1_8794 [Fusarium oxysporum]KAI3585522.1 hypothetical protein IWW34DRAFT_829359 [Fusarium oxysporum f. sp. albedinis]KAJ0150258.1 putative membrane protein [Fusarium oxysporum f. sp. albedinis]KAJ4127513.1 hypothetical protein NW765_015992 [Fusarium oxysporum]